MGFLTMIGTGFGAYIMAMAALSPCPLLVHSASGTAVIVRLFLLMNWDIKMFYLACKIYDLIAVSVWISVTTRLPCVCSDFL